MLGGLFEALLKRPELMPVNYLEDSGDEPVYRQVCDYIAGMTDHFLLRQHAYQFGRDSSRQAL